MPPSLRKELLKAKAIFHTAWHAAGNIVMMSYYRLARVSNFVSEKSNFTILTTDKTIVLTQALIN
jgi:hypothetical protein